MSEIRRKIELWFQTFGDLVYRHRWIALLLMLAMAIGPASQLPKITFDLTVEGFDETSVHHAGVDPLCRQEFGGPLRRLHHGADRHKNDVLSFTNDFALADRELAKPFVHIHSDTASPRVAQEVRPERAQPLAPRARREDDPDRLHLARERIARPGCDC